MSSRPIASNVRPNRYSNSLLHLDYLLGVNLPSESDLLKINNLFPEFIDQIIIVGRHARQCTADSLARLNIEFLHHQIPFSEKFLRISALTLSSSFPLSTK